MGDLRFRTRLGDFDWNGDSTRGHSGLRHEGGRENIEGRGWFVTSMYYFFGRKIDIGMSCAARGSWEEQPAKEKIDFVFGCM